MGRGEGGTRRPGTVAQRQPALANRALGGRLFAGGRDRLELRPREGDPLAEGHLSDRD